MNVGIRRTATILSALVIGAGTLALATPEASAASRGTATKSEARKVVKQGERQKCLTIKESQDRQGNGQEERHHGWVCRVHVEGQERLRCARTPGRVRR